MSDLPPNPPTPGEPSEQPQQQYDYFGFSESVRHFLPDKITYVEIKKMNEGDRAKYQKQTSRDLVLERQSGDARMKVDPGTDRHALITAAVIGWNLVRYDHRTSQHVSVRFDEHPLRDFLQVANPEIVDEIEKAVRKANPWLLAEMSVEDIDKEIENLKEMREVAEKREAGN